MDKEIHRFYDIMLTDLWGIEHVKPDMFDDKGVSDVLIHSIYGEKIREGDKNSIWNNKWNDDKGSGAGKCISVCPVKNIKWKKL